MINNNHIRFLSTGDIDQRKPVDFVSNNITNKNDYQLFCINQIFTHYITLKINKRLQDTDKQKLHDIKTDLFNLNIKPIDTFRKQGIKIIDKLTGVRTINNMFIQLPL